MIEKLPTATDAGDTAVTVGTGFSSEIMLLPERVLSETEVASMLTEAGLGRAVGAVYTPVALILPTVASPPAVPFTDHVTDWSITFLMLALNCCVSPERTLAVAGVTVTDEEGN